MVDVIKNIYYFHINCKGTKQEKVSQTNIHAEKNKSATRA